MLRLNDNSANSLPPVYPPACILREAHRLADKYPPARVRQVLDDFFNVMCRSVLGKSDREQLLDRFLADRESSRIAFLYGLGLRRDPKSSERYLLGTWSLHSAGEGSGFTFVIHGVLAENGQIVSVPLTGRQFNGAALALRAIRQAVAVERSTGLRSDQWRRIWWGRWQRGEDGSRAWVAGLRYLLHQDFMAREDRPHG
jgi:hypothetical protein